MALEGIGLGSSVNTADYYTNKAKTASESTAAENVSSKAAETGVIYEKSSDSDNVSQISSAKTATVDHEAIIAKMKQDAEQQTANLRSIVEKLMLGQSKADTIANNGILGENSLTNDEDMWKFLAKGDFTVDAATKAQAEEDISEDGYWGVEKTSDRILDFAKALAGNDPTKAQQLLDAFKEGYKQAEDIWGGELPEISKKTYDAVEQKFNDWMGVSETQTEA
ncbi:MAG: hypothetical protein K6G03_02075 [Lachnospiraceae bacterium]|nr:hypothetical protein [Lachnospiraceae bacterium]